LFAAQHPKEVVGLIFVDARHESVEPTGLTPEKIRFEADHVEQERLTLQFIQTIREGISMGGW